MAEYCLTAEEVLYLAAVTGADTFYGVPDVLSGLSDQELRLRVIGIESGLQEKGYMEEDFDGNKNVRPKLLQIIDLCGKCERFLSFEKEQIGESQYASMYFLRGNGAYRMEYRKEGYVFSETNARLIREEIRRGMPLRETGEEGQKGKDSFLISYENLEKAGRLTKRGSAEKGEELLKEAGAPESMAQSVTDGMLNKADFYALLFMDLRREEEPGYSIQCLQGGMLISVEYETKEDEDYVRFSVMDDVALKKRIDAGFEMISCVEEEAFT